MMEVGVEEYNKEQKKEKGREDWREKKNVNDERLILSLLLTRKRNLC